MTGAPMPAGRRRRRDGGASERLDGDRVRLTASVAAGAAVRRPGSDVRAGDTVLTAGTVVTPAVIGLLASVNARQVDVYPAARVQCCPPVTSWSPTASPLDLGQIRESNLSMLARACSPMPGARSSTWESSPTTRRRWSRCCATPPPSATRSSPAAVSAWATTTSSRPCSAASPTWTGCRSRSSPPSRSRSGCSTAPRCSACPATRSARWSASSCSPDRHCAR